MNDISIGTMSSGYSSKSGNPLATSIRLNDILSNAGELAAPSYFCLFGKITKAQLKHEGMDEDIVHMNGPAELIRAELMDQLPDYMVPGRIVIINKMPHSSSGKIDVNAIRNSAEFQLTETVRPFVAPRNIGEKTISDIWCKVLKHESVSIQDDFFELGGNSLQAVAIIRSINQELGIRLPVQLIFSASTIEKLAATIVDDSASKSRAIFLAGIKQSKTTIFCWPGLGGYPLGLRNLAEAATLQTDRCFYGIQSFGINEGEQAFSSIEAMASKDIQLIRSIQPHGPYHLWGFSFGARVAYETAWQLEQLGESVSELVLLAPGSPKLPYSEPISLEPDVLFKNPAFLTILLSVFAHEIDTKLTGECLKNVHSYEDFISFVCTHFPTIDITLAKAIIQIVSITYAPEYQISLTDKPLRCPVNIWRASGDGPSFIDKGTQAGLLLHNTEIAVNHYNILKLPGLTALKDAGCI